MALVKSQRSPALIRGKTRTDPTAIPELTLSAFFDESRTHTDSSTVVVGGYIASAEQWEAFRREWQTLLSKSRCYIEATWRHFVESLSERGAGQRNGGYGFFRTRTRSSSVTLTVE
jgi:hypothetical protein